MSWESVTSFDSPVAAEMAKNYLAENGIVAMLGDEEIVATLWSASNALGGIKLLVEPGNVALAEYLLARRPKATDETPPETAIAATPEDAREATAVPGPSEPIIETPADKIAERAWRATVFGLGFPPLQLYGLFVLLGLRFEPTSLSPENRWKPRMTLALSLPIWALVGLPLLCLVTRFHDPHAPRWHSETIEGFGPHAVTTEFPAIVESSTFRNRSALGEARVHTLRTFLQRREFSASAYVMMDPTAEGLKDPDLESFLADKLEKGRRTLDAKKWIEHGPYTGIEYRCRDTRGQGGFGRGQLFRLGNYFVDLYVDGPTPESRDDQLTRRFLRMVRLE